MRMTYDPQADALAWDLVEKATTDRMVQIVPGVNADLDADGRLISVEVLHASAHYSKKELLAVGSGEVWLTLTQAAKEAKLSPATLRLQLNHGRLKGRKTGRDWQVSRTALWNYLEGRAPAGKPPAHGKRVQRVRTPGPRS